MVVVVVLLLLMQIVIVIIVIVMGRATAHNSIGSCVVAWHTFLEHRSMHTCRPEESLEQSIRVVGGSSQGSPAPPPAAIDSAQAARAALRAPAAADSG